MSTDPVISFAVPGNRATAAAEDPFKVVVGELGTKENDEIQNSITQFQVSLTSDQASQVKFTVTDPGLKMHDSGYFVIRRPVYYADENYEISTVRVHDGPENDATATVSARHQGIQKMKRDKGGKNFGKISPTTFANQLADTFGLEFFGEKSSAKAAITRTFNENTDESSWDVLARLAGELEYEVFEASGILYFASEKFIVKKQTKFTLNWRSEENDPLYLHDIDLERSDDEPMGGTLNASVSRLNGVKIRPGMVAVLKGVEYFDESYMVTSVDFDAPVINDFALGADATPDPVRMAARIPEPTKDSGCETQTFKRGSSGACVKRLQAPIGTKTDGLFGPKTQAAVKKWQGSHGLKVDGIVGPATWKTFK